jgi:hypothetical protein
MYDPAVGLTGLNDRAAIGLDECSTNLPMAGRLSAGRQAVGSARAMPQKQIVGKLALDPASLAQHAAQARGRPILQAAPERGLRIEISCQHPGVACAIAPATATNSLAAHWVMQAAFRVGRKMQCPQTGAKITVSHRTHALYAPARRPMAGVTARGCHTRIGIST